MKTTLETRFEKTLFASRWLMAPMYFGLAVALAMLTVLFVRELFHYVPQVLTMSAEDIILVCLTLIDLSLAANLLLIVMFSGYENFVSKLNIDNDHADRSEWMGTVDFSAMKMKLIASIVAISAIHLLKRFMEIGIGETPLMADPVLFWLVVIHLTFVVSGVLMAAMDWLSARSAKH